MAGTVHKLKDILFNTNGSRRSFRLLTVSDGAIHDPIDVKNAGAELARMVSQGTLRINSQAVRLFTSHCQPDTTALCSLLQLNNMTRNQLIDIQAQTEIDVMTNQIADLFINDGFTNGFTLNSGLLGLPVFLNYPWEQTPQSKLHLIKGNNVFWMKEVPTTIKVNDAPVNCKISIDPEINLDDFHNLIGAKFDQIVGHIKVLKIVGSKEAVETSKQALEYFTKQETNLGNLESLGDATILSNRVKRTIELKRKNLSRVLATIINDDTVSQLNSAQRADYLREVGFTRSSRGLAKRAAKEGLDFNEIARNEVMEMAKHFCEIEDVDDSNHLVSFFAQDTTFGGIQALVDVSKNENFNLFDVDDIIELLNVVGVACSGPIGDFPDPMTWSVNEIYLGCYSSVSDVLVGYNQSKGGKLLAPAIDKEITNVIPVFDDKRIAKFLKKYAPSLLEYACSIGMRRVIADVPMTAGYTICAGVWKMISEIDENKSTLHLEVFKQILTSFDDYVGKYFDHISPFIHDQDNEKMSFHIGYNGISNMMLPLLQIYKDNDEGKLKLIPDILRTIYAHEVWQTVRHAYKGKQDSDEIIKKMLCKLLGINLNDHKITLQKLFIPEPELAEIMFYDKPNIDETYLNKFKKPLSYINYLALLPKYFEAAVDDFKLMKDIPKLSDSTVLETLQVDYSYDLFIFFNVFQALRYPTRASREDSEMNKMKILDLKNQQEAMNDVKDFIRELLKTQYLSELSAKRKQETKTMAEIIAGKIFESTSVEAMIDVWRNGITRCGVTYKIENISSPGYKVLCQLLCSSEDSSQRSNIFRVLLLCVDNEGLPVWNNGSTNFITNAEQDSFEAAYQTFDTWDNWNALMTEYKSNFKKVYRDYAVNRHGHGNSKRSYCANGYKSMKEFRNSVPEEEFREYCETHIDCCGVRNLDPKFLKTLNVKL